MHLSVINDEVPYMYSSAQKQLNCVSSYQSLTTDIISKCAAISSQQLQDVFIFKPNCS